MIQIFVAFFLWDKIFENPERIVFGYDRSKILTYVFAIIIIRALVLSARAADVAGDVAQGELSNYLIKPMNYFKYWFTRDMSSKILNISFAFFEFIILYLILRPPLFFQQNILIILAFLVSIVIAIMIYFYMLFIVSSVPFWAPELGWGSHFLVTIILIEFLSGALFPIDILPAGIGQVVMSLPFPYLIYFPVQVYLGNITGVLLVKGLLISSIWLVILGISMKYVWSKGLKVYEGVGR